MPGHGSPPEIRRGGDPIADKPIVLLSIDEEWATAIMDGDKLYEYRRQPPTIDPPYRVVLYATQPVEAVVGAFITHTVVEQPVDELVDETVHQTPHTPEEIRSYFAGKDEGAAIRVGGWVGYDDPVSVDQLRHAAPEFCAPQNFRYLRPDDDTDERVIDLLPHERGIPWER